MLPWPKYLMCPWEVEVNPVVTEKSRVSWEALTLTCIVLLLGVFDVGRELGEDVDACSVGLPVFRSQSGIPGGKMCRSVYCKTAAQER